MISLCVHVNAGVYLATVNCTVSIKTSAQYDTGRLYAGYSALFMEV
jgi:hypothetical protein